MLLQDGLYYEPHLQHNYKIISPLETQNQMLNSNEKILLKDCIAFYFKVQYKAINQQNT